MTALMWQTALLLLGAYFLGAWVACMVRRFLFAEAEAPVGTVTELAPRPVPAAEPAPAPAPVPPRPVAVKPAAPAPAPAAREAADEAAARFSQALSGSGQPPAPRPSAAPAPAPRPVAVEKPMELPTPPDRSGSGVSTMVDAIRSRVPEATAAAGSALAAAAAAVSRPTTPPPGSTAEAVLPAASSTAGRASVSAQVAPSAAPSGAADDLTRIQGIDNAIQTRLNSAGVRRFAEIAAWKPDQVAAIAAVLGIPGKIERENWIEQAQILAKGGETMFSSRRSRGELATAEPTADEGQKRSLAAAGAAAAAAALSAARPDTSGSAVVRTLRPAGAPRDNLQRVGGINGEVERLLNVQGVHRYGQIANWTPDDVAKFDRLLGNGGRIGRENWIEQAKVLERGDHTAYSREFDRRSGDGAARPAKLADAIAARATAVDATADAGVRSDLAALRSVKSEAYRPADVPASGGRAPDDLKRIRGVGVLIEKKLNSLGVTRYEQVASWTQDEIDRYSDKLDFKGRIERENWVEQARILSTGGATEFSKRVDRGEVESSKP